MSNGSPPKPPPRRPPSPPPAEQVQNPFMVPDQVASVPTPPSEQVANPFLMQESAPNPQPEPGPQAIPPSQGAPLQARRGAVSPDVRDAHAEFRKGGWKKPLAFGLLAAAIGGGLFFGMPEAQEEKPNPFAETSPERERVIGASVSPDVIPDPDKPSLQNPEPSRRVKSDEEQEPVVSPDRPDRSDGFADAFKSKAK